MLLMHGLSCGPALTKNTKERASVCQSDQVGLRPSCVTTHPYGIPDPNCLQLHVFYSELSCRIYHQFHSIVPGLSSVISRREITARVGGSGNMAIYRHVLVLPPPSKSLPPKNEKLPTAEKLPPYTRFIASAEVVTAKKRKTAYRQKLTAVWYYRPKSTAMSESGQKGRLRASQ